MSSQRSVDIGRIKRIEVPRSSAHPALTQLHPTLFYVRGDTNDLTDLRIEIGEWVMENAAGRARIDDRWFRPEEHAALSMGHTLSEHPIYEGSHIVFDDFKDAVHFKLRFW